MLFIYHLLILFFLWSPTIRSVNAQSGKYTSANKKAIKLYEKAVEHYNRVEYSRAEATLLQTLEADSAFVEARILLGDIYDFTKRPENAIAQYRKAIHTLPDFYPGTYFNLANLEYRQGNYPDAKSHYEKYITYNDAIPKYKRESQRNLRNCNFAIKAMKNPVPFNPANMGDSVNTPYDEYLPALTADEQTLLFTMRHPATEQTYYPHDGTEEDFFITVKENGTWKRTMKLPPPINTPGNEGAHCLSPDGLILIFTGCNRTGGHGSCDLYFAKKTGNQWSNPMNMGPPVNSLAWESQPTISSDGNTLYFVSNRDGGKGGKDIWKTELGDDGFWSPPVNLGDSINTPETEQSPFIHPDNKTLYFSSDGHTGMGGEDIFIARRIDKHKWAAPVNLGYPINTWANESGLFVTANGSKAYFASSKGKKNMDLYYFELPAATRPAMVSYMKGKVFNSKTSEPVDATFELIDIEKNETATRSVSNKGNGEFLVCLPLGRRYALNVSRKGYLFYSDHFELTDTASSLDPVIKNVPLAPIEKGEKVILKNIFYETDKYDLKPESKAELGKLTKFLQQNEKVAIEISGHTDDVGDKKYNLTLSENRAKAVYEYLISNGIPAGRITYKGYGDTQPEFPNDSGENRAKNRRTEFRVTGN